MLLSYVLCIVGIRLHFGRSQRKARQFDCCPIGILVFGSPVGHHLCCCTVGQFICVHSRISDRSWILVTIDLLVTIILLGSVGLFAIPDSTISLHIQLQPPVGLHVLLNIVLAKTKANSTIKMKSNTDIFEHAQK